MTRIELNDATYGENLPGGTFAALIPGHHVSTSIGQIPLPGHDVLFLRISEAGGFLQMAGQAQREPTDPLRGAWRWSQTGWDHASTEAPGVSPVLFDRFGGLHIAGPAQGSQGYRYLSASGELVSGDDTLNQDRRIARELGLSLIWEYTNHGDVTIGQGETGALVVCPDGTRRMLELGDCRFIRFNRRGNDLAVYMVKPGHVVMYWLTVDELAAFPLEAPVVNPPDPPDPPDPPEPDHMNYNTGPLNDYAQRRWQELPHETRHQQAEALHRILYEYRQQTGDPIEVFRKGCTDTTFTGSDGHCYAEDICVINEGGNGKWYQDVGVSFGIPSARLDFGGQWQHPNGSDAAMCFPPPPPLGVVDPPDPPPPPPPPQPPPPPPSGLEARVFVLETFVRSLSMLPEKVARMSETLTQHLEHHPTGGAFDPNLYEVKTPLTFRSPLTGAIVKKGAQRQKSTAVRVRLRLDDSDSEFTGTLEIVE